ncbi:hypothetical protein QQZ08_003710 [Neonectria magnoliae]|uniref:Uncharacterized protein n=1 Tax=Neonectria magnoliae TaxID=2732573 RepID=A0ABR1I7W2_9HYPO
MSISLDKYDTQASSPFFTKLNADVRRMVYTDLFGSRDVQVYLGYDFSKELKSDRMPGLRTPQWAHNICAKDDGQDPRLEEEEGEEGPLTFLAATMIGTCKQADVEGIAVGQQHQLFKHLEFSLWSSSFVNAQRQYSVDAASLHLMLAQLAQQRRRINVRIGILDDDGATKVPQMFYEAAPRLLKMLVGNGNVKAEVFATGEQKMNLEENMGGYESDLLTLIARGSCLAKEGDDLD